MKNVVLIGASGFVGTAILNELLNRGHKVTAIVRDPAKVTASNPNLKVIQADVTDTDVLIEASKGKDAVISAYNPGWKNPNIYEETRESWTCSNADCGIRVRVSDGELLRKITLLMNRVIANADLMLPHPKIKHRDSAVVLNLQQQISDEMEQERPSEERIATLLCEIAGQLYKETNAKAQIAAQIARKRVSLMKPQDAFNAAYFSNT